MSALKIFFFLLVASVPIRAFAQPSAEDRRHAGALFQEGERLYSQEKWPEALAKFEESYSTVPHVATRFNIGKCFEKLGRYQEADTAYADVESGDDPNLATSAREARARVAPQLAAAQAEEPPPEPVPAIDQTEPEHHEEPAPAKPFGLDRMMFWGGVGLAAVGVTLTVVFGLRANGLESDVEDARASGPDPDDVDSGETAATVANVGIVVAIVGAGLAATGFLLGMKPAGEEERDDGGLDAHLGVFPGGLVLSGRIP
jgi:hypothetical protein